MRQRAGGWSCNQNCHGEEVVVLAIDVVAAVVVAVAGVVIATIDEKGCASANLLAELDSCQCQ